MKTEWILCYADTTEMHISAQFEMSEENIAPGVYHLAAENALYAPPMAF